MILILHIHSIPFHYFEFVKPIEDIVCSLHLPFTSLHYKQLTNQHLKDASRIIIPGTSLRDNAYLKDTKQFDWITSYQHPILGICGGMQLLAAAFDEDILQGQEIGLHTISLPDEFLGSIGQKEVYELHNNYVLPTRFRIHATSEKYPQAIKHPTKPFYGVLFHPEVRNKQMIQEFIKLGKKMNQ